MRASRLAATLLATALLAPAARAGERRKIALWSFAPNNVEEYKARKAEVEARFGIDLDVQVVAQNAFVEKLQAAMVDGKGAPDIVEWMIENNRILNADPRKSLVVPLDPYVAGSSAFAGVVPHRVAWVKYGGHVYGLPHDVHPVVLVYNDTLWKAAGVDVARLETWDEFFEAARKLTAERRDGKPLHYALPTGHDGLQNTMFMIWQQSGAQILDARGAPTFTSPDFRAFVAKWLDWQRSGAFTTWDWGNFKALLASGTLASFTAPDWWVPQVNLAATGWDTEAATAQGSASRGQLAPVRYQFRVRPLPAYRKGGPTTASWGGSFMAIPKGTRDPDVVYKIIEYLEYDPGALKIRWERTNMIPPLASVWGDPMYQRPDPRFGGQRLGELLVASARALPKVNAGDVFWDAIDAFTGPYGEIESGEVSIEEGLAETNRRVQRRHAQLRK